MLAMVHVSSYGLVTLTLQAWIGIVGDLLDAWNEGSRKCGAPMSSSQARPFVIITECSRQRAGYCQAVAA